MATHHFQMSGPLARHETAFERWTKFGSSRMMLGPFESSSEFAMATGYQLAIYAVFIMTASMAGGLAPALMRFSHRQLHLLMSLVAGLMLGVGVFILLPHGAEKLGSLDAAAVWLMVGLLGMFFLIRAFHFHQHVSLEPHEEDAPGNELAQTATSHCAHDHDHDHDHSHDHGHGHGHAHPPAHKLSWAGIGFGLAVHTLIDGLALAASVQGESAVPGGPWFAGVGTFLAIALHKPLDAMSITTLMASGGWSKGWRFFVNLSFAAMCPLGVLLFFMLDQTLESHSAFLGATLAFSAGVFLCISLGDLLPEIQFHDHDRLQLSAALLAGVALAYGLGCLEPAHHHGGGSNDSMSSPHQHR